MACLSPPHPVSSIKYTCLYLNYLFYQGLLRSYHPILNLMKSAISLLLLLSALFSCSESPSEKTKWLLGTWETQTANGKLFETWRVNAEGQLVAKSYYLKGADTVLFETVDLIEKADTLFYVVHAAENPEPVSFYSVELRDDFMSFENPKHDFPTRILYQRKGSDSLIAEVSGMYQGQPASQGFPMRKIR